MPKALCAVLVAGWLVERLARSAEADARTEASARYFLAAVVPEASGLAAAAEAGAAMLYAVPAEALG